MKKEDFIAYTVNWLNNPKNYIGVTSPTGERLATAKSILKYNWSKADIESSFNSIDNFLIQLPMIGYGEGSELFYRYTKGSNSKTELNKKITLKFSTPPQTNTMPMEQPLNQSQNIQPQLGFQQQVSANNFNISQSELVTLSVQKERYADMKEKLEEYKKQRDEAQSELKIAKEDLAATKRKIETLEDRHSLQIDRIQSDKKSFFDTEAGKEAITALGAIAPVLAKSILPTGSPQASPALGNPLGNLSEDKKAVINQIVHFSQDQLDFISDVMITMQEHPETFTSSVQNLMDTTFNN